MLSFSFFYFKNLILPLINRVGAMVMVVNWLMRGFFATEGIHGPLGCLDEPAQQEKPAEPIVVCAETTRKRRRPYRTTFPNREIPYGTTNDVTQLFRTCFGVSVRFGYWYVAWGGISCNLGVHHT
jgi:hypothetical protein